MVIGNLAANLAGLNLGVYADDTQQNYGAYADQGLAALFGDTQATDYAAGDIYGNDPYAAYGYQDLSAQSQQMNPQSLLLGFVQAFMQLQQIQDFMKTLLSAIFGGGQMQIDNPYAQQQAYADPYAQLY